MLNSVSASPEAVEATGLIHRVYPGSPEKMFLLVHGRTGDASVMWTFSKAFEEFKPLTLAPQAPDPDPLGGFTWWPVPESSPGQSARGPETAAAYWVALDYLKSFILTAAWKYGFKPSGIYALGFSQGAALLAGLSLLEPQMFRHVGLLAGFVPEILFLDRSFTDKIAKREPVKAPHYFIGHGLSDETVPIEEIRAGAGKLRAIGRNVTMIEEDVGHKVGSGALKALSEFYAAELSGPKLN